LTQIPIELVEMLINKSPVQSFSEQREQTQIEEGFFPTMKLDTEKNRTIGMGFNLEEEFVRNMIPIEVLAGGRPMTREESIPIFNNLYDIAIEDAKDFAGDSFDTLNEDQQGQIIDMAFNMGLPKLQGFELFQKSLQEGDLKEAGAQIIDSKRHTQVPNRSQRNADAFLQEEEDAKEEME